MDISKKIAEEIALPLGLNTKEEETVATIVRQEIQKVLQSHHNDRRKEEEDSSLSSELRTDAWNDMQTIQHLALSMGINIKVGY